MKHFNFLVLSVILILPFIGYTQFLENKIFTKALIAKSAAGFQSNARESSTIHYKIDSISIQDFEDNKTTTFKLSHHLDGSIKTLLTDDKNDIYFEPYIDFELFYSKINITSSQHTANENFSVYPNPAEDKLTIKSDIHSGEKTLSIVDMFGKVVIEKNWQGEILDIPIEELQPGTYFYSITSDNKKYFNKLLVR